MDKCHARQRSILRIIILGAIVVASPGRAQEPVRKPSGDLMVFHAGSLALPLAEAADAFIREYPGIRVLREAAGSRDCARKIAELGRPCDVFASADYAVIDSLLIPQHAEWCIGFVTNEMVIAYHKNARRASEINSNNWFQILLDDNVAFSRSEPNSDPCGYRAVLTMKLAEKYYRREGLAERLSAKDRRYIRPKETDLLALLETKAVDYIFLYRSVTQQHGLEYVALPDEVNLKQPKLADLYRSVSIELSGKAPGETITQYGEPMVYGVTIPKNAPNPEAALAFVIFLLDKDKGMAILEKHGQPSVIPAPTATYDRLPTPLKRFAAKP